MVIKSNLIEEYMGNKSSDKNSVVKIDSSLLGKINNFIEKEENRLKFVNKKQFVDIAVFELLKKMGGANEQNK